MASEIPATSEVLLKSDASKQFLDTLLGQGWDAWGDGLGGSQAAELMLQLFGAFNLVALAIPGSGPERHTLFGPCQRLVGVAYRPLSLHRGRIRGYRDARF